MAADISNHCCSPLLPMAPDTTLYTFMLQTHPSVQSVQLFGSWDNFSVPHNMERDIRRDLGEWRGLHSFNKIVTDGDSPASTGRRHGLQQGQSYYYYYEVNGSAETHNPSLPTTTACPFLPGQTVNTLDIPVERRQRMKSASMNSLRTSDHKTMDPTDRFRSPRPSLQASKSRDFRIASASTLNTKRSARSVSPGPSPPSWTSSARRFLGFKPQHKDERGRKLSASETSVVSLEERGSMHESRSNTPSGSIRSRDMSPESLRRFLSDELPAQPQVADSTPMLSIPDDIAEENEDDVNFAASPLTGEAPFTVLSPPPSFERGLSAPPARHARTPQTLPLSPKPVENRIPLRTKPSAPDLSARLAVPRTRSITTSATSSAFPSPTSSTSQALSQFSFFDDSDEDDEDFDFPNEIGIAISDDDATHRLNNAGSTLGMETPITSYGLPSPMIDTKKHLNVEPVVSTALESPALVARSHNGVGAQAPLFTLPNVDIGLDDMVGDANWMAPKGI